MNIIVPRHAAVEEDSLSVTGQKAVKSENYLCFAPAWERLRIIAASLLQGEERPAEWILSQDREHLAREIAQLRLGLLIDKYNVMHVGEYHIHLLTH